MREFRRQHERDAIIGFVNEVTRYGSSSYVPPAERIAVFKNDDTLLSEMPLYFQFAFMLDEVKAVAPMHPEWRNNPALRAVAAHDQAALEGCEFACDRRSKVGKLERAWDQALAQGWIVLSMKDDWTTIYPSGAGQ